MLTSSRAATNFAGKRRKTRSLDASVYWHRKRERERGNNGAAIASTSLAEWLDRRNFYFIHLAPCVCSIIGAPLVTLPHFDPEINTHGRLNPWKSFARPLNSPLQTHQQCDQISAFYCTEEPKLFIYLVIHAGHTDQQVSNSVSQEISTETKDTIIYFIYIFLFQQSEKI